MPYPIFVFDLHGVLFKPDYQKIIHTFYQIPKKRNLFISALTPKFLSTFFTLIKKGAVPEEYIMKLGTKVKRLHPYIQTGIALANSQKPQENTIAIVQELKKRGYPRYIFSNIGEQTLADLYKKYPHVINLFDGIMHTSAADDYLKKPRQGAFEKYARTFGQSFNDLIFIDNKHKNIRAAQTLGIESIFFKNPTSLYKELKKRNFLA